MTEKGAWASTTSNERGRPVLGRPRSYRSCRSYRSYRSYRSCRSCRIASVAGGRVVHDEHVLQHAELAEQLAERLVRRVREVRIARRRVRERHLIDVRESLIALLRAVVHPVLERD